MTAQITDMVIYKDQAYDIVGVKGEPLFSPQVLGLNPCSMSTACYRGFHLRYQIVDNRLTVHNLTIGLSGKQKQRAEAGQGPAINGVLPKKQDEYFTFMYTDLNLLVEFTGGLLLATDFIQKYYVHMGFQSPWKFETVHEFIFEKGQIKEHFDRSEQIAKVREKIVAKEDGDQTDLNIYSWIKKCFSLDY